MNILRWLKKKKAVSPVIAVVLMIAVAVAIAVIVYAWASGFTSEKTGAESGEAEQIVVENQVLSGGTVNVFLRNALSTGAVIDAEYHEGALVASGLNFALAPDSVTQYTTADTDYQPGEDCMLVTEEGTQIKFKIKG
jgi:flagellin-like protein